MTRREHVAYDCGYRLGVLGDPEAVATANRRGDLFPWLYRHELAGWRATPADTWWRWWWRGYAEGSRQRA